MDIPEKQPFRETNLKKIVIGLGRFYIFLKLYGNEEAVGNFVVLKVE